MHRLFITLLFVTISPAVVAAAERPPLEVERVEVDVTVDGRLARTTVRHVVRSHSRRTRQEGVYEVGLQEGAAITRLAMTVEGRLMEGEIVERTRAREVYDGIVREKRDPALLEWQAPGLYRLEIFPIEPLETKEIVIEYEEVLPIRDGEATVRYTPIDAPVTQLELRVTAPGRSDPLAVVRRDRSEKMAPVVARIGVREGDRVVVQPVGDGHFFFADGLFDSLSEQASEPLDGPRGLVFAVDTSAAGGWDRLTFIESVATRIAANRPLDTVEVVAGALQPRRCRSDLETCFDRLELRGATNLGRLLTLARDTAESIDLPTDVVLFSDGVPTMGIRDLGKLSDIVGGASSEIVLHTVAVGDAPNAETLAALARTGRGHTIAGGDVDDVVRDVGEARRTPRRWAVTARAVAGRVEHLRLDRSWIGAGQRFAIVGRAKSPVARVELTARSTHPVAGEVWRRVIDVGRHAGAESDGRIVERALARGQIRSLDRADASRDEVVALAQRSGVLSRRTSYLVLENAAAYRTHRIARRKFAERTAAAPKLRMSKVVVNGSLDKEIFRRTIRQSRRETRWCYEQALRNDPTARGRVTLRFSLAAGRLVGVGVVTDEIGDAALTDCLLDVARTWRFPVVRDGGRVIVHYPFEFSPSKPTQRAPNTVATLEAELPQLSARGRGQLVGLYLAAGRSADAEALLAESLRRYAGDQRSLASARRIELFGRRATRDAFPDAFLRAARQRLQDPGAARGLHGTILERMLADGSQADVASLDAPGDRIVRYFLGRLSDRSAREAGEIGRAWLRAVPASVVYDAVSGDPRLEALFGPELARAILRIDRRTNEMIETLTRIEPARGDVDRVERLLTDYFRNRRGALELARRARPGDVDILTELASIRAQTGYPHDAELLLSEIVEFRPGSPNAERLLESRR